MPETMSQRVVSLVNSTVKSDQKAFYAYSFGHFTSITQSMVVFNSESLDHTRYVSKIFLFIVFLDISFLGKRSRTHERWKSYFD